MIIHELLKSSRLEQFSNIPEILLLCSMEYGFDLHGADIRIGIEPKPFIQFYFAYTLMRETNKIDLYISNKSKNGPLCRLVITVCEVIAKDIGQCSQDRFSIHYTFREEIQINGNTMTIS